MFQLGTAGRTCPSRRHKLQRRGGFAGFVITPTAAFCDSLAVLLLD